MLTHQLRSRTNATPALRRRRVTGISTVLTTMLAVTLAGCSAGGGPSDAVADPARSADATVAAEPAAPDATVREPADSSVVAETAPAPAPEPIAPDEPPVVVAEPATPVPTPELEPEPELASVELTPGITVRPARGDLAGSVEVDGIVCLTYGWLEQIACGTDTREHESLVVIPSRPSDLHAAMLLAGLRPGGPGRWSIDETGTTRLDAPTGDPVSIRFRWTDADGTVREATPSDWVISEDGAARLDDPVWRFGGSLLIGPDREILDPATAGPDARYVSDLTGSIIGLVTFGDEMIGFEEVIPDATDFAEAGWMADTDSMPEVGTEVVVVLERAASD